MRWIVGVLALGLMGCPSPAPTPTPTPTATPTPSPTASASASAHSNGARKVSEETDDYLFDYAYPKEAGRIPALAALLDGRLERDRAELAQQSAEARKDARGAGFPYNKYSLATAWKVVADLPGWLSLSGDIESYNGGAHGNQDLLTVAIDDLDQANRVRRLLWQADGTALNRDSLAFSKDVKGLVLPRGGQVQIREPESVRLLLVGPVEGRQHGLPPVLL